MLNIFFSFFVTSLTIHPFCVLDKPRSTIWFSDFPRISTFSPSKMANPTPWIQILLFLLCNFFFFISESINFTFHGFNTNSNLVLDGSVIERQSGALRLTDTSKSVIGHAFYPTPIPISNNSISFSTNFVFQINPSSPGGGGYGLGFVMSPSPLFPGAAAGHFMGVFNSSNSGNSSNHIFMVEFDTVRGFNETFDDDGNHVGINVNGMDSVNKKAALYDGDVLFLEKAEPKPIQARVDYDGVKKKVNVTIARLNASEPIEPLLSVDLDLSNVLLENMYAGFSAATGKDKSSSHYILGWSFRLNGISDKLDPSLLRVINTSSSSSTSNISTNVKTALIAALSVVLVVSLASLILIIFYRRSNNFEVLEEWELDCPHRFRYKELYTATKGFTESEKIGVGGFGVVYHGVLPSTGGEVAVKKITNNNSSQGMREFAAEIECLGKLRHKNLVHLQGWCKHKNELLLVYEYVPNGSLHSLIYKSNPRSTLTWKQRFDIIKGIASGLLYLHEDWEQVVIHRDVKSSNVLIDGDMSPRLGDFGLARLHDHGKNTYTTRVVGTIGYIAPELSRTGKASTSSDVFAFGILLLEIACGRAAVVFEAHQNVILVDWVVECMQKGKIFDAVDAKMDSNYVVGEMELVLGLGLLCSHPRKEMRPTMRQVVKYLNGDENLPLLERLSSDDSRRVDEITSRLLELGLVDRFSNSADSYNLSICIGVMSSSSFGDGR